MSGPPTGERVETGRAGRQSRRNATQPKDRARPGAPHPSHYDAAAPTGSADACPVTPPSPPVTLGLDPRAGPSASQIAGTFGIAGPSPPSEPPRPPALGSSPRVTAGGACPSAPQPPPTTNHPPPRKPHETSPFRPPAPPPPAPL